MEQRLSLAGGAGALEAALHAPPGGPPAAMVVVCHPYPLYGGDMNNNAVRAVVAGLLAAGVGALTFNFRGVGRSTGSHDGGAGEQDDVATALACLRALDGVERVGLAGYSFGATMAAAVADPAIAALALVSLPLRDPSAGSGLAGYGGPLLIISGDGDHVSPAERVRGLATAVPRAEASIIAGADHFWQGHEAALGEAVGRFFAAHL